VLIFILEVQDLEKINRQFDEIFAEIYNNHHSYLLGYMYLIIHDPDLAEDLVHDIFLRLYKSRNMEIAGIKIRNYLKKAARNIAIDHLRKQAREEAKNKKVIIELREFDEEFYFSLDNSTIQGEVLSTVQDVLDEFSEKKRKIFIGRIIENKTFKQISKEERISPYAVKRIENEILFRLREKLKIYF
jgi:RNA polymerase sigma factor (sigma-70 family)